MVVVQSVSLAVNPATFSPVARVNATIDLNLEQVQDSQAIGDKQLLDELYRSVGEQVINAAIEYRKGVLRFNEGLHNTTKLTKSDQ